PSTQRPRPRRAPAPPAIMPPRCRHSSLKNARSSKAGDSMNGDDERGSGDIESLDQLRTVQLDRLRWSVRHAYDNVEHYRRPLDDARVHPDDVRQLSDLSRLPCTSQADLRDH